MPRFPSAIQVGVENALGSARSPNKYRRVNKPAGVDPAELLSNKVRYLLHALSESCALKEQGDPHGAVSQLRLGLHAFPPPKQHESISAEFVIFLLHRIQNVQRYVDDNPDGGDYATGGAK